MRHQKVSISEYQAVESHYSGKWTGIILDEIEANSRTSKTSTIVICLIVLDQNGHPVKNRLIKHLNKSWTRPVKPLTETVYKSWLILKENEDYA